MTRALGIAAFMLLAVSAAAQQAEPSEYAHNRDDYLMFRDRAPDTLEPNYLPFMAARLRAEPLGFWQRVGRTLFGWWPGERARDPERLVFCHWEPEDFPLATYVERPEENRLFEDSFDPWSPDAYVAAVSRALWIWQRDLDGVVSFEEVDGARDADLTVRLLAEEAPAPDPSIQVLGATPIGGACEVLGGDPDEGPLDVRFRVPELRVYLADQHGLLQPDQVERIALHELGHALGMRGHSPIPADLMYRVAKDRIPRDGLGASDVNSFLSLYALPNGTLYADPQAPRTAPRPLLPDGEPELALAPHVDTDSGFEMHPPAGWTRVRTRYGLVAINGPAWDYDASFQLFVQRFDTIEQYLDRFGAAHLRDSMLVSDRALTVAGRRARQATLRTRQGTFEIFTFVETGDGRIFVSIAECAEDQVDDYRPWFDATLATFQIRD